jgi:hypothetical protein
MIGRATTDTLFVSKWFFFSTHLSRGARQGSSDILMYSSSQSKSSWLLGSAMSFIASSEAACDRMNSCGRMDVDYPRFWCRSNDERCKRWIVLKCTQLPIHRRLKLDVNCGVLVVTLIQGMHHPICVGNTR